MSRNGLMSIRFCVTVTTHNLKERFIFGSLSVGSVHGELGPKQRCPAGRGGQRTSVHHMAARKHRKKKGAWMKL